MGLTECGDAERVDDPKRLRALTHPLRWALLNLLMTEETATATRCAQVLGESVASCSYHLNMLAKYKFVEHAPDCEGREKPWRLTNRNVSFSVTGLTGKQALTGEVAVEALLDNEFASLKSRLRLYGLLPEKWQRLNQVHTNTAFLTAAELDQVHQEILAITSRFEERRADPGSRPAGAREVHFFAAATVAPTQAAV